MKVTHDEDGYRIHAEADERQRVQDAIYPLKAFSECARMEGKGGREDWATMESIARGIIERHSLDIPPSVMVAACFE